MKTAGSITLCAILILLLPLAAASEERGISGTIFFENGEEISFSNIIGIGLLGCGPKYRPETNERKGYEVEYRGGTQYVPYSKIKRVEIKEYEASRYMGQDCRLDKNASIVDVETTTGIIAKANYPPSSIVVETLNELTGEISDVAFDVRIRGTNSLNIRKVIFNNSPQ